MGKYIQSKEKVIALRSQGLSYSEIIEKVPVPNSTLSNWLSEVRLNEISHERLQKKIKHAYEIGAAAKRKQRLEKTLEIKQRSAAEINEIGNKELFYMGIMLYWAEGSKANDNNVSESVVFSNSDPSMCKLFLKWTEDCLHITLSRISFRIYIHESWRGRESEALKFWSDQVQVPKHLFKLTCFTRTKFSKTRRRKDHGKYHGQLRIRIAKSTDLNRVISGWIQGICLKTVP